MSWLARVPVGSAVRALALPLIGVHL